MLDPVYAALIYSFLATIVALFQLALTLGAPWGSWAMGGFHPGKFSPALRSAAFAQGLLLLTFSAIVLTQAGVVENNGFLSSKFAILTVVAINFISAVLNTITPSKKERILWGPVAVLMFLCSAYVALS